jgi:hypothetical protein
MYLLIPKELYAKITLRGYLELFSYGATEFGQLGLTGWRFLAGTGWL